MLIKELFGVSLAAIRANALRSFLTTLGIIIGVGAVITMVALGEGAQQQVRQQIEQMGTNTLTIRPGQARFGGVAQGDARLYTEDADALKSQAAGIVRVAPEIQSRQQIVMGGINSSNQVVGSWPEYFDIQNMRIEYGRLFHEGEVQGRRRVVVVGSAIPEVMQVPAPLLVGRTLQIRGISFEVVGVLAEKGDMGFSRPDEQLYIPVTTAQYRVFGGRDRLNSILAQVEGPASMDLAFAEIDRILRRQHQLRPGAQADFNIRNSTDLLQSFEETNRTFTYLLAGIAGVSLLVGGIGIMNIMLVSVTERTREIGVRKALGATKANILVQFLVESLVLCFLGGLLGVALGYGGAEALSRFASWNTSVPLEAVGVALGFSVGIGLFFGIFPAQRAARLDPIVSLRYE
jgi:putative ABC transport system permease protein